jgi:hypothetical protein
MTCTITVTPNAPTILNFQPYGGMARVNGSDFAGPATHLDTHVTIGRLTPAEVIIADKDMGFGATNFTLTGLSLLVGEVYFCRLQYKNEAGLSIKSRTVFGKAPSTLSFPTVDVPLEPVPAAPLVVPINPSYVARPVEARDLTEWESQTGDVIRRLPRTRARQGSSMAWENLNTADRDAVRAFLLARLDVVEAFATGDEAHGTRTWFIRAGRIETREIGPGVWTLEIEADEVFAKRFFTVGVSAVGGPDPIR